MEKVLLAETWKKIVGNNSDGQSDGRFFYFVFAVIFITCRKIFDIKHGQLWICLADEAVVALKQIKQRASFFT